MENKNSNISLIDNLKYMIKNVFGISSVPITFLNSGGTIIYQVPNEYITNPVYSDYRDLYTKFLNSIDEVSTVFTYSTAFFENYAFIVVREQYKFIGTIIIGPCLFSEIDTKSIDEIIRKLNIQIKYKNKLTNYYEHMPLISYEALLNVCSIFHYIIYNEYFTPINLVKSSDIYNETTLKVTHPNSEIVQTFDQYMLENIKSNFSHHSPNYELELLTYIKNGDLSNLIDFLGRTTSDKHGLLSNNPLRNHKDVFISFIPLVSHAAIEGGLDWELSLSLGDYYIHVVEEENSIKDILNLYLKMFIDYTKRVKSNNSSFSSPIIKSKSYVSNHIFEKITISGIAETTGLNPNYLSHLFKKETGITISNYIQHEKIEIAKKMLLSTNKSISEIYISLGFIDQSHFSKIFKKFTGLTPSKYRLNSKSR